MNSKACLTLAALSLTTLSGCSASNPERIAIQLPPPPEYAQSVEVKKPRVGEPLVGIAARERAGRIAANGRLNAFREWYEGLRENYAK